jgi:hypothetical protein
MRHLFKVLGLLLLLMTAEQGAVVHELSHYSGATESGGVKSAGTNAVVRIDARGSADANCALCPAFAQVLTPAFSHAFQVPLLVRAGLQRSPDPGYLALETAVPTPRSRGPPSLS